MSYSIEIDPHDKTTRVMQVINAFMADFETTILSEGTLISSINLFTKEHRISRDTIETAYRRLHQEGYVTATANKGHCVQKLPIKSTMPCSSSTNSANTKRKSTKD